ncbi:metal ABC transporter ATP-binding protein [Kineosporia succinea]|uniref:Zinc/manganese transport system ATP-binding protein n=1 Tax=Kineosporia succinea TaxID=84632 RepID=A0ABT9P0D6_9ACTN|nr:ABC transporter ATP-binding protein [Kineosporia succinea]MDP9826134.1 zinc/manganese transport system ATP-binding protein [Kineosporia succinea]
MMSEKVDGADLVRLSGAALGFDAGEPLWKDLDLAVRPGEFVAVLGANGSGKTTLLRCLLGLQPLSAGTVSVLGRTPAAARREVGYVPQQRRFDPLTPVRARDLVGYGYDGHRWGLPLLSRKQRRARIDAALAEVGATRFADAPASRLSGGQQQLLRIAQALACDPALLLCDEPLLSLDLHHQREVCAVVDRRRRDHNTGVLFVTHEINPVLPYADRVLYLAGGRFTIGPVNEVMTSQTLTRLYGSPVDVIEVRGQLVVVGIPDHPVHHPEDHDETQETAQS